MDENLTFGGLEDLADEETLNDYCEQYIEYKESLNKPKKKSKIKNRM